MAAKNQGHQREGREVGVALKGHPSTDACGVGTSLYFEFINVSILVAILE